MTITPKSANAAAKPWQAETRTMAWRYRILAFTTLATLLLDQSTKLLVDRTMLLGQSIRVVENFFHLTYVRNQGAAFGMLANSPYRTPFFIGVALIASGAILWMIHRLEDAQRLSSIALSLIFAGAVGNLIDRVRLGEVIDFLDVHWYQYHWPAFNVADSAITVGVGLLIWEMWREERSKRQENPLNNP